jgi:iron(III) transport system permease protein
MAIALPALDAARPHKIDLSWPILMLFAALLCVLIILPMSWLFYYSLVDRSGAFTLDNFKTLVTDPIFVDPLMTTVILATSSSVICCAFAAPMGWLVAHRYSLAPHHTRARHGLVRDAAVPRCDRLGIVGCAQ